MRTVWNAFLWTVVFGFLGAIVGKLCDNVGFGLVAGLILGALVGISSARDDFERGGEL